MMASFPIYSRQHWKSYDPDALTINTDNLSLQCPLDNGQLPLDSLPPRNSTITGPLLSLPPELLHLILNHLDIHTLTHLRRLSTQARLLISSSPLYASLYAHSRPTLRAILSTGSSPHVALSDLHAALTSPSCSTCSRFGSFFNLLTATRTCHFCFATTTHTLLPSSTPPVDLLPITIPTAKATYGLSPATIRAMPKIRTLPGTYGREKTVATDRTWLCLPATAQAWGVAQHGSLAEMSAFLATEREKHWERMRNGSVHRDGGRIVRGTLPGLEDFDRGWDNPHRHMVVVRFPWLNREGGDGTGLLEWGVPCGRCREESKEAEYGEKEWNVMYTEEGLVEHLKGHRGL